ncbi:putative amidohydrolase YtcJ [Peribacillus deserti]|uniref:Amidohydrolase YtcJ n=1 Tax=Peribacillus deserti TaxID=673318 RepID=A0ABS2QIB7_9BACI|nr:amidohydrolase [Peribacillus deserti]MBM7692901.1 putative amidohydrolase YtcJ [Peribacillus deserti]
MTITLWHGGTIYTMRKENEKAEAVLTDGKKVFDTGNLEVLLSKYGDSIERKINLQGKTMFPGLVDSHMHLIGHGEKLMRLNLSGMKSKEDVLNSLKQQCSQFSDNEWIIAEGWNENEWNAPELILADDLDRIAPNHPVLIKRVCRHAIVVNSKAMDMLNLSEDMAEPAGGVIGRYRNGRLNGLFKDTAQDFVLKAMPPVSEEYLRKSMTMAIQDCHRLGLTGVHTEDLNYYSGFEPTYNTFLRVIEKDGLALKAHLLVHHEVVDEMQERGYRFKTAEGLVEFGPMKIFADGSLGGRTALLAHPYQDDPSTNGVAIHTPERLMELVKKAREYEMPVAVHAIGDLAFEYLLDAIEEHPPKEPQRDRLIHAQILRKELIDRAKKLPVVLDIQPVFVTSDFPWVIDRVGSDHMKYNYAWKTLLEEGLKCAGGSDAPIEELNPLLGIYAAVYRTKLNGDPAVYGEQERLSMYEAISLFTKGSAFAINSEYERGMIQRGFYADFTVFDKDPFTVTPEALLHTRAVMTVINGEIVYEV